MRHIRKRGSSAGARLSRHSRKTSLSHEIPVRVPSGAQSLRIEGPNRALITGVLDSAPRCRHIELEAAPDQLHVVAVLEARKAAAKRRLPMQHFGQTTLDQISTFMLTLAPPALCRFPASFAATVSRPAESAGGGVSGSPLVPIRVIMHTDPVLVGREDELARAIRALAGDGSLVITGEAGAGKTALLSEALSATDRLVMPGQCFRSLAWTAGFPLQQALRRPMPTGDAAWTAQWVVRSCRQAVLRLDDLQWADPLTLAVVRLLPRSTSFAVTVRLGEPGAEAAVDAALEAGAERLDLDPLGADDATDLALFAHPRLRRGEARALAERCGGNPLLIQELGADPEPKIGLRRSVTGRLRRLGAESWRGFALLALADEPLPEAWLPEASTLVSVGFALVYEGMVQPRHPLLAEVVAAELADGRTDERVGLQLELARRAERSGHLALAARNLAAAGDRSRALEFALRAAEATERPGERASLLHLAAGCADEPQSADLAAHAVEQLVTAGDYTRAADLLEQLPDLASAQWFGLVGRVRWQLGDDEAALAAFETGLAVAHPGTRDAVLLQAEYARAVLLCRGDAARGLALARAAHDEAVRHGCEQPRTLAVLGTAEYFAGIEGDSDHLAQAIEMAAQAGDLMVEFTSANNLISVHESAGRAETAGALADRFAARAEQLHMRGWQQQMRAMDLNVRMHLGDYDRVVSETPRLLAGALDRRTRDQLEVTLGLVLVDLGRHEVALERLLDALATCADGYSGRGNLHWVRAEAYLWAGDPAAARDEATVALEFTPPDGHSLFALTTHAHAQVRLDEPVEVRAWPEPHVPLLAGAPLELAGLAAQSGGDDAAAAALFVRAADAWAGHHRRGELRCRWLAADLDGDPDAARQALVSLEQELADAGLAPLLGRVRRSLRARGVHSAAPRGRAGDFTAREREVLDLVAEGLSTEAIAARLGVAPSTVAAQITSARARRGASTRWQAASG
ncbi:MAG: AAA family ATPase [Jatrophihabitans sp.]